MTRSKNPKRYSPEFKDEATKMMVDLSRPIAQVVQKLRINCITLGFWVKAHRAENFGLLSSNSTITYAELSSREATE